ncbi:MAG: GIY-YIG homing endonuclease [Candidatus Beckwithbacteria bacterium GW2011_GWA2_43_10]|uniref:GIY-YIG homing endonuclease n=1 Tax=Candidatus Beckwithbacteria bacterium GW2011_GWA2_43_10 TaxID=1618369 RepID=A0A0G1C2Y5_9BACT|nr:MAG: GIY-YIG homing endonuclease [Candidatus Beckwithbacteria bacterium GW2011_GWA2_43_10]
MHYVYVLKSQKSLKLYIGKASDLKTRIVEHNKGLNRSTKYGVPWRLIYYEAYLSKSDASQREASLKQGSSSIGHLKKRIKNSFNK